MQIACTKPEICFATSIVRIRTILGGADVKEIIMALKIEFYPPHIHFRRGACAWITRGFCVMISSVYLSKFKIIETCLFLALFCLCFFCNINGFIQIIFFVVIIIFNRIILLEFFYLCIDHYIVRSAF